MSTSLDPLDSPSHSGLSVIEWEMMDKQKFFPLALSCSMSVRALLYPLTVVKTRLQIQRQDSVYRGTWDALVKIRRAEGMGGLYKGFWINTFQIFSSVAYVSTYETVRHTLAKEFDIQDNALRGLVGGAAASAVGQTIIVPFDVVSQHMMILGNAAKAKPSARANLPDPLRLLPKLLANSEASASGSSGGGGGVSLLRSRGRLSGLVMREIYRQDGLRGFYRGYLASLVCYCPNSAGFWAFYHGYAELINQALGGSGSQLAVQCTAAPLAGLSVTLLTNPLDLLRARLQVQRAGLFETSLRIWREEGAGGLWTKGLSTRMTASLISSLCIILGYESLKRLSVKDEYRDRVKW